MELAWESASIRPSYPCVTPIKRDHCGVVWYGGMLRSQDVGLVVLRRTSSELREVVERLKAHQNTKQANMNNVEDTVISDAHSITNPRQVGPQWDAGRRHLPGRSQVYRPRYSRQCGLRLPESESRGFSWVPFQPPRHQPAP